MGINRLKAQKDIIIIFCNRSPKMIEVPKQLTLEDVFCRKLTIKHSEIKKHSKKLNSIGE